VNKPTGGHVDPSDSEVRAQRLDELAQWSTFPVDDDPRPMVLLSDAFAGAGFYDATKTRFRRAVEVDLSLPPPVLEALRLAGAYGDGTPSPVRVVSARASHRDFRTDRGLLRLPVWELEMTNTIGPRYVMSADWQARVWAPQVVPSRSGIRTPGEASIAADEVTVVFTFAGCPAEYGSYPRTLVEESDHAVAIHPIAHDHPNLSGPRLHYMQHRTVEIALGRPLGGRVLLGFDRGPVSVTQSVASV